MSLERSTIPLNISPPRCLTRRGAAMSSRHSLPKRTSREESDGFACNACTSIPVVRSRFEPSGIRTSNAALQVRLFAPRSPRPNVDEIKSPKSESIWLWAWAFPETAARASLIYIDNHSQSHLREYPFRFFLSSPFFDTSKSPRVLGLLTGLPNPPVSGGIGASPVWL